ncbi:uncharacterized protein A4U43_C01F5350 [Asparagus officinalis]|uniref:Coiled-coil domain-containing protein 22 homolog n=2 Tax=Asparagus officinalis TaxID=4686 RepID=A0A5P1FM76_ASPOF|nr:uncharacterized protein A4U43_C01F5350 [Asparagus officinalis]
MADKFKICEGLASAVKGLGYREPLSFHQFLYPSDEDSSKLVRFLVGKLSESSEDRKGTDNIAREPNLVLKKDTGDSDKDAANQPNERADGEHVCQIENMFAVEPEDKLALLKVRLSKLRDGVKNLQSQEKLLIEAKRVKALEVQKLEHDYEILKVAVDMAFDDQHDAGYFIRQLNEQVESRRSNIKELESQWNCLKQTMEERKMTHGLSAHILEPGVGEKPDQLKEIEQETEATISEINRRELECSTLLAELQKQPKLPPRKSYIQRITEITKNSWKQDADIARILKETRELKLESNSVRERLDRTYMVVDETVFREAKKDAMGRQVYRLLTSIHDSFEQISEKILATDRARREAAELEAKLAALSSRSFGIDKLQSDLDSIRKENELLEQQLHQV